MTSFLAPILRGSQKQRGEEAKDTLTDTHKQTHTHTETQTHTHTNRHTDTHRHTKKTQGPSLTFVPILLRSALFLKCSNSGKNGSLEMKFGQKLRISVEKQWDKFASNWLKLRMVPPGFPRFPPFFGPVLTSNLGRGWPERFLFGPHLGTISALQSLPLLAP